MEITCCEVLIYINAIPEKDTTNGFFEDNHLIIKELFGDYSDLL